MERDEMFLDQVAMIFPGGQTQGRPEARVAALPGEELLKLATADGETVAALWTPTVEANAAARGPEASL